MIPLIDLFSGPGGIAEGFSVPLWQNKRFFSVRLSVEKELDPFQTLLLRAFYRQFAPGKAPHEYYQFLKNKISLQTLYAALPTQEKNARNETWQATLGLQERKNLDERIKRALSGADHWILTGGPPCQAYSSAGIVGNRTNADYKPENDERYLLYKEYIRVIAVHHPSVFVMENVPGLLFAKFNGKKIIESILSGLRTPSDFAYNELDLWLDAPQYRLFSLDHGIQDFNSPAKNFCISCNKYGIPQYRNRIIIIGVRDDIDTSNFILPSTTQETLSKMVLHDLPKLRSTLSKEKDSPEKWQNIFKEIQAMDWLTEVEILHDRKLKKAILLAAEQLYKNPPECFGNNYLPCETKTVWNSAWYADKSLKGVLHHIARPHMRADLHRYLFCSCFLQIYGRSPKLQDFPLSLLPKHKNAQSGNFDDRFRVISLGKPSPTVISHLAKDGHAFIHPDPLQCRSLTPREAARLQTFPDNYYFFGGRASQFRQIGNAVPPWLAYLIAQSLIPVFTYE